MYNHQRSYPNEKGFLAHYIKYLNNNIEVIKKDSKIQTWEDIINLRSYRKFLRIKYHEEENKFIMPDNYFD